MRIRVDDGFDNELEEKYRVLDDEVAVKSNSFSNGNGAIIDVYASDIIDTRREDKAKEDTAINKENVIKNDYSLKKGYNIEIHGATIMDDNEEIEKKVIPDNIKKNNGQKIKHRDVSKENLNNKNLRGKIEVASKLGDANGKPISDAKINLYMLNGISPKLISSKVTNENGELVFDNLENGSYRVIAIVNRKYFEKPVYISWNEVTITDDFKEEKIIVVNKIKIS